MENLDLLSGLKDKGVTIENIDVYLQKQGVLVSPHIGRRRVSFALPKEFIRSSRKDTEKKFLSSYVKAGRFSLLSEKDEKELTFLEQSVRRKVYDLSIGCNKKYIPTDVYSKEFVPFFKEQKEAFFAKRDSLLSDWENIVLRFKEEFSSYLRSIRMNSKARKNIEQAVFNRICTKKEFENSFYMDISLSAFPIVQNIPILDEVITDEMKDSIRRDATQSINEVMGTVLSDIFDVANRSLASYKEKGKFTPGKITSIQDMIPRVCRNNILNHPLINNVAGQLKSLIISGSEDEQAEILEEVVSEVYGFAKQIGVDRFFDTTEIALPLTYMEAIYDDLAS